MGIEFAGGSLAGWTLNEVYFVAMLYQVGHQLFTTFFLSGLFHVGWFVWSGRMDYVLLKPLHPLIGMHTASEFIISNLPNLIINMVLFGICGYRVYSDGAEFTISGTLGLIAFFILGIGIRYGIALWVVSPAFFAEKLAEGEDAYWSLLSLAKYPTGVFPRMMQNLFTFILPVATVAAIPSKIFFGKSSWQEILMQIGVTIIFVMASISFFSFSAKRYQSVNTGA
ncbi:MAG: ABC-2 family transporter protein [Proteobacteria bacterium]|nr:ABC-2 family transporter protein [Pseudomonadota bacterium]